MDSDLPVVFEILGEVDSCHTAFADLPLKTVAVSEGGREPGGDLGHI